jgi:hypothetical protein
MSGISSSAAVSIQPAGHGSDGGDDDDDTSPLLDLLQKLPDLCVDKRNNEDEEVHGRSATAGTCSTSAVADEPTDAVGHGGDGADGGDDEDDVDACPLLDLATRHPGLYMDKGEEVHDRSTTDRTSSSSSSAAAAADAEPLEAVGP